jgi:hypothetical protein
MRWISRSRRAPPPPEEVDHAGDRQVGLHHRRQRCGGHAGQPRVLRLRGCIVGARPLRIVDELRGDLDQDDVAARKVAGRSSRCRLWQRHYRPDGAVIVRRTVGGALIDMAANAEAELRVLVQHLSRAALLRRQVTVDELLIEQRL